MKNKGQVVRACVRVSVCCFCLFVLFTYKRNQLWQWLEEGVSQCLECGTLVM